MNELHYTDEKSHLVLLALLKAHGIRRVFASPGTTNMALIVSMQSDPYFTIYSCVDERSAAYMAVGMAAESGEPVIISCTGATASRNYYPALTEAYYRKLPILAITSHNGQHGVGHLYPQFIDRTQQPHDLVRYSLQLQPVQTPGEQVLCERMVNTALLELTRDGGGPVHINLFIKRSRNFNVTELPTVRVMHRYTEEAEMPELPQGNIAVFIGAHREWTAAQTQALDSFCASHNAVAFCDMTSGYHGKYRVQFALPASQRQARSPLCHPRLVIHIGEVSGDYYTNGISPQEVWRVSEDGEIRDLFNKLTNTFAMSELAFFRHYTGKDTAPNIYYEQCQEAYRNTLALVDELPFSNLWVAAQLAPHIPHGSCLHVAILNSLRSWNMFEPHPSVRTACNVGGFGIDGALSTLIGASFVHPDELYFCIVGDLAFFYDMNSLGNRHIGNNVRILLVNNGLGQEFRNSEHPANALGDTANVYIAAAGHFGAQSQTLVRDYAENLGFSYMQASSKEDFRKIIDYFTTPELTDRPLLLEIFTDSTDERKACDMCRYAVPAEPQAISSLLKKGIKKAVHKLASPH